MNSLDGMQSATPGPFFFTRVQARLHRAEKSPWEAASAFLARPVVAIAIVCLVILMNTVAVLQEKSTLPAYAEQVESSSYDDLDFAANTFYEDQTKEP